MHAGNVNWTEVLVVGVPAYIAAVGGVVAAWRGTQNRAALQTPSGDPIGHVVERTHDMAAVGVAAVTGTNGPAITQAVAKLNADPSAPVELDPATLDLPKEQSG